MRLKYSYFLLFLSIFLFSSCSSHGYFDDDNCYEYDESSWGSSFGSSIFNSGSKGSRYDRGSASSRMRISDGVIIKIKVLGERSSSIFGFGNTAYRYQMETFLDDGRVFKNSITSEEIFYRGDRVRLYERDRTLVDVVLLSRN